MATVASICQVLEQLAPSRLAEEWDNVGLLVGERSRPVQRLMTCLTITPESAAEAIERQVEMIISHHPLPFRELRRLTGDTTDGQLLLQLIEAGIAIYSPHTALDSATAGINQQLAEGLALANIEPLVPHPELPDAGGTGRRGQLESAITLDQLAARLGRFLDCQTIKVVGSADKQVERVGIACGSGGELLPAAARAGCDVLVSGEARFHTCLEASARGVALILCGHFASECFALRQLALQLDDQLKDISVFSSSQEDDPIRLVDTSGDGSSS